MSKHPIDGIKHLVFPWLCETHIKSCSFIERQLWDGITWGVLDDTDWCSMELWVHEQVLWVHVLLHEGLILLSIPASDNQVILACNEPNKLFKPEDLAHNVSQLWLFKFGEITGSGSFSLFYCDVSCIFGLDLFLVRLLFDLKVLFDVELCWYAKIDVYLHHWVKIWKMFRLDLVLVWHRIVFIIGVKHQADRVFLKVHLVNEVGEWIASLALLFNHPLNLHPADTWAYHDWQNINNCLSLVFILQKQLGLEFWQILLTLETQYALLLVFLDFNDFREDLLFFVVELLLLLLLLGLGKILIYTLIKVGVFQVFFISELWQDKAWKKVF